MKIFLIIVYCLIFFVCLFLNIKSITILYKSNPTKKEIIISLICWTFGVLGSFLWGFFLSDFINFINGM